MSHGKLSLWRVVLCGLLGGMILGAIAGVIGINNSIRFVSYTVPMELIHKRSFFPLVGLLVGIPTGGLLGVLASFIALYFLYFCSHITVWIRYGMLWGGLAGILLMLLIFCIGCINAFSGLYSVNHVDLVVIRLQYILSFGMFDYGKPWFIFVMPIGWGILWGALWSVCMFTHTGSIEPKV